jgi:hypothetical protein
MQETAQQKRFVLERARALATIYLTGKPDLIVSEETTDIGVDYWVTLNAEGKDGQRRFGVEVRGVWSKVTAEHANKVLYPTMQGLLRYTPYAFPVVLFFFTMENSEGWYTWVAEPVVSSDGEIKLDEHPEAFCHPLDSEAVDEIAQTVDRWFDAFFAKVVQRAPSRKIKR